MMINEEILGGLKSAIERGESIQKAMMTFYNSGYQKEQIEEAARFLSQNPLAMPSAASKLPVPEVPKPVSSGLVPLPPSPSYSQNNQIASNYGEKSAQKTPQAQASKYEGKKSDKTLITILIIVLVLLFGVLGAIFFFRNEIINLFSNMFG